MLAHRIFWSFLILGAALVALRRHGAALRLLRDRRKLLLLALSGTLLALNWVVFIWAVSNGQTLQSSLGYFVYPLVSVVLGRIVLNERLAPRQWAAVALVAIGVLALAVAGGSLPWIALALAFSFAFYGLLRKINPVESLPGLWVETALTAPFALGYLLFLGNAGAFATQDAQTAWLLICSGALTAFPLLLFAMAARHLTLGTIGLMQYIAPTGQFLIAVLGFNEPFGPTHFFTFGCIWAGLAIYSLDFRRLFRRWR